MSSVITSDQVKKLREQSGAAMMDCKRALEQAGGNTDKAVQILKEKGLAKAEKKAARATAQGLVVSYVHQDRVGVLLEIGCETDFVAKCDDVRNLAKNLVLQIASMNPLYVSRELVSENERAKLKASLGQMSALTNGKTEEWLDRVCLLDQIYIKDAHQRVRDLMVQAIAKVGENLVVKRFARFEVGQV